jgi:hypothetical protein
MKLCTILETVGELYNGYRIYLFTRDTKVGTHRFVFGNVKKSTKSETKTLFQILDKDNHRVVFNKDTGECSTDFSKSQSWSYPGNIEDAKKAVDKMIALSESLLVEHYVNLIEPNEKRKYADEVWDMLQKAYEPVGGFKSANSPEHLVDDSHLWKLVRRSGKIVSVIIYKDQNGRKLIGMATDGSSQGKKDASKIASEDAKLRRSWAEASGPAEKFLLKNGAIPIPAKFAKQLTGKEILGYDIDGIHYTRLIGGEPKSKAIYGFPRVSKELEADLHKHRIELHK